MKNRKRAKKNASQSGQAGAGLPVPGVKLLRTLEGHQSTVRSVAFDPRGGTLASGSEDLTVRLWDIRSGKLLRTLIGHQAGVFSVAFDPRGGTLASGSEDRTVKVWDIQSGKLLRTLKGHQAGVFSVAFDPRGGTLASGSEDQTVKVWDIQSGKLLRTLEARGGLVYGVAFDPRVGTLASGSGGRTVKVWDIQSGKLLRAIKGHQDAVGSVAFDPRVGTLASGSADHTVKLWDIQSGKLLRTLERHTDAVDIVTFSADGRLMASKSHDGTICLWNTKTWAEIALIPEPKPRTWIPALAFHPALPLLSTAGMETVAPEHEDPDRNPCTLIHVWQLDHDLLLGERRVARFAAPVDVSVQHRTAKVILVGDTGVGKSGLAHRLVLDKFIPTHSSHARRALVLESSTVNTASGVNEHRETVLWDLAGQPAYRLVHQLAMDEAAVACVLFDARSETNPLEGAAYWSQALDQARTNAPITKLLVPARTDVGGLPMSPERLRVFAEEHGFAGIFRTSAFTGEGCDDLRKAIREHIHWEDLPAVSSTQVLAALRDFVERSKGEKVVGAEEP